MKSTSVLTCAIVVCVSSCKGAPPEPGQREEPSKTTATPVVPPAPVPTPARLDPALSGSASGSASAVITNPAEPSARRAMAAPVPGVPVAPDDPLHGVFSLDDATAGLTGSGALQATITTSIGSLTCKLLDDKAPLTVANFIGLSRGTRPWKDPTGAWVKKPAYDGTVFHRIIKGFMIQGGDPNGNGSGEPGYNVADELWPGAKHDRAGLLCMANRGPNTNGAQFFITDASAPHLDRSYTIFGECAPEDMVHKLASVEVSGERPVTPPKIKSIKIARAAAK